MRVESQGHRQTTHVRVESQASWRGIFYARSSSCVRVESQVPKVVSRPDRHGSSSCVRVESQAEADYQKRGNGKEQLVRAGGITGVV